MVYIGGRFDAENVVFFQRNDLLEAALEYAAKGWAVFPCDPDGALNDKGKPSKDPLKRLARNGYHSATTDTAQIRRWWAQAPAANIGLALAPNGLVAVDADTYKAECGWQAFIQGRDIPPTFEQSTSSGGRHYVFQAPDNAQYDGHLCAATEIKFNGYILLEPSRVNGSQYRIESDDDPAPAPDWLPTKAQEQDDGDRPKGRTDAELDQLLDSIGAQNFNNPVRDVSATLIGRGFSDWNILRLLQPHFRDGNDERRARDLIKRGRDKFATPDPGVPGEVRIVAKQDAGWPEPVDLFGGFATPAFPTDVMPDPIRAFAEDQSELIGVDPAILCMTAIGAVAGCLDDRIEIQPKRYDPTWTEAARLWVGIIGNPSTYKSPGMGKALGPVKKVAGEWRKEANDAIKRWKKECEQAKAEDKNASLPEKPVTKRLTVGDVTVEKLSDIMAETEPRGILVDKDELTGWLASMDAYKNGAGGKDKAAWLEAYNGGAMEIDRVTRGSVFVENWSASVIGGIQPQVIDDYANANNHDGMLQRFLLAYAQPAGRGVDRRPDLDAKDAYDALLQKIARMTPGRPVELTAEAHEVREAFNERLHKAVTSLPNPHLVAMLGKWAGTFARLCLVLHAVACAQARVHPSNEPVSGDTAQAVDRLLWRTLLPHAMKFYSGLDATEDHARQLAGLLLAKGWTRFSVKRDLHNNMVAYRKMHDRERDEMLDRLVAYSWIAPDDTKLNERGRPAAYHVNPAIHARFADQAAQETDRRARVAQVMSELTHGEKM